MTLERAYSVINSILPVHITVDSFDVVKQVEEYRQFWKPKRLNVLLLAESHVYTRDEEYALECNKDFQDYFIKNYPTHFVRFVYCLCSGEPEMFSVKFKHKRHIQFWKIFCSCVANSSLNLGFEQIRKRETTLNQRLRNKVRILQEMHDRGIWLLDASIVGIYGAIKDHQIKQSVIRTCWKNHIQSTIAGFDPYPKAIVVIGKGVANSLNGYLDKLCDSMGTKCTVLPQPQGNRGSSEEQMETYRQYQRICSKYAPPTDMR